MGCAVCWMLRFAGIYVVDDMASLVINVARHFPTCHAGWILGTHEGALLLFRTDYLLNTALVPVYFMA